MRVSKKEVAGEGVREKRSVKATKRMRVRGGGGGLILGKNSEGWVEDCISHHESNSGGQAEGPAKTGELNAATIRSQKSLRNPPSLFSPFYYNHFLHPSAPDSFVVWNPDVEMLSLPVAALCHCQCVRYQFSICKLLVTSFKDFWCALMMLKERKLYVQSHLFPSQYSDTLSLRNLGL